MAVETIGSWGAAIKGVGVQFAEFFSQAEQAYTPGWEPVVKMATDDGAVATFSGKTGSGTLTITEEGSTYAKKNRYKLYDTAFTHKQYTGQVEVTRMNLINREFSAKFDELADLSTSANVTRSKAPAQIFNGAFSNSGVFTLNAVRVTTYADGKNLCSTAHPRVDGGSAQSNASSTGITLTETNVETGRVALVEQLQDDGTPVAFVGSIYLVVPTRLEKDATIFARTPDRPQTQNNDINFYAGGYLNVLATNWLGAAQTGSDTAWFLVAPSVSRLKMIVRTPPFPDTSVDKNSGNSIFSIVMDMSVGSCDWRGVWGSKGDTLAYAS